MSEKGEFSFLVAGRQAISDTECPKILFFLLRTSRQRGLSQQGFRNHERHIFMSFSKFSRGREDMRVILDTLITQQPHLLEFVPSPIQRNRSAKRPPAKNLWGTPWGRMIRDPEVKDPHSRLGRLFRLRFRMPFDLFRGRIGAFSEKGWISLR